MSDEKRPRGRRSASAEAALHTALGIAEVTFGATPRVHVEADFERPLVFNEAVDVELGVRVVGRTSVEYRLTIGGPDGPAVAGAVKACFIDRETRRAVPWPDAVRERLSAGGPQAEPGL